MIDALRDTFCIFLPWATIVVMAGMAIYAAYEAIRSKDIELGERIDKFCWAGIVLCVVATFICFWLEFEGHLHVEFDGESAGSLAMIEQRIQEKQEFAEMDRCAMPRWQAEEEAIAELWQEEIDYQYDLEISKETSPEASTMAALIISWGAIMLAGHASIAVGPRLTFAICLCVLLAICGAITL